MFQKMLQNGSGGNVQFDITNPLDTVAYTLSEQTYTHNKSYKKALIISVTNSDNVDAYAYVNHNGVKQTPFAIQTYATVVGCTLVWLDNLEQGDILYLRGIAKILFY